ncbi:MAG: class D beta-lactamase [Myxococcales bacterium]|nr:class D beta-lactamase [Myxococcales bacterium]
MLRLVALAVVVGCAGSASPGAPPAAPVAPAPAAAPLDVAGALARAAAPLGLPAGAACLVVATPDGAVVASEPACAAERLRPASTFKIVNTLIGADVGLITSADAILPYDPVRYPPAQVGNPAWTHDQSVRDALAVSAVPLYRRLAIDIGAARMQAHLDALAYGNRSIAGGLDRFWLDGGLAVSAAEQVALVRGLLAGTLPVTPAAMAIVREALPRETVGAATIHWKTGTGELDDGAGWIAWLVGWVDGADGARPFACWLREPATVPFDDLRAHRIALCRGALADLGLIAATP